MNIWAEGIDMQRMIDLEKKKKENKQEDKPLSEMKEELQDTTANGRRLKKE